MKNLVALIALMLVATSAVEAATFSGTEVVGFDYRATYLTNETVPSGSFTEKTFYNVGGFDDIDFVLSASSGSIPTANYSWKIQSGDSLTEVHSETVHSGSGVSEIWSDVLTVRFDRNAVGDITVTGNILFTKAMGNKFSFGDSESKTIAATSTEIFSATETKGLKYLAIVNDSDEVVYVSIGETAVMNKGIRLNASGGSVTFEYPVVPNGVAINGICSSGGKVLTLQHGK